VPEEVFRSGEERVVSDLLESDVATLHMGTVALGIRHILCAPLRLVRYVDGAAGAAADDSGVLQAPRNIGVLYLDSRDRGTLFSDATRTAVRALAGEAAAAIENARLYREALEKARIDQELQTASAIQRALLPAPERSGPFYECVAASIPCLAVGGDFFDYLPLADGRFGVAIGDVTGKGPPAALLTAMLQGILAAAAFGPVEPRETVTRINRALIARNVDARFATIFLMVVAEDGHAVYCNAGHNPPLLFTAGGVRPLEIGGTIVGVFEHAAYHQAHLHLQQGDTLVLYTDGVSEARNAADEEFGDERIRDTAAAALAGGPAAVRTALLEAVRAFSGGTPQNDDLTVVVMRYGRREG
jgi:sigma-B regulation protein RsbU (phosphoserine phosphatase)